jgi:hypothetical protein
MGTQSELAHIWQTNNGSWSDWSALGNSSITDGDPITVGSNSDGRLEVFSGRWHIWQTAANNGWANWHSLAGPAGYSGFAPVMALNNDGRLEVFTRGADGALWHIWQNWSSPTGWSDWNSLHGAITSDPAVGLNGDGRLEVFARGTDSTLWHIWQTHPHAGPWSGWASLKSETDGNYPSAAAALNTNGKLEVFARGTDGAVWHTWQTLPHAGPWNDPWESLGGNLGGIVAFPNYGNHRLELFGMNGYTVMHTWKDTLTGNWH